MDLSGKWHSRYRYSRGQSEHVVMFRQEGDQLHGQNEPDEGGSRLKVDLSIDGNIATGQWEEQTSPDGPYKGVVFHGALQLTVSPDGKRMEGQWVGFNSSRTKISSGEWELTR